jgi:hypothetical protein
MFGIDIPVLTICFLFVITGVLFFIGRQLEKVNERLKDIDSKIDEPTIY